MIVVYTPSQTDTLASFSAEDSWNGNRRTTFTINRCYMGGLMPDWAAFDERSRPHSYSIQSEIDKAHRGLPDSLVEMWLAKKVPSERLPKLLHDLEPQLRKSDYLTHRALNPMQRAIRRWAPLVGGAFITVMGLAVLGEAPAVGVGMCLFGVLIIGGSLVLGRRFSARRRTQCEWVMSQL